MSKLLEIAISQIGVKETVGEMHNETILNYSKEAGFEWVNDDETPWCSIFMNWCAKKAEVVHTGKVNARSWLNIGKVVEYPEPGDVVVFWRESIDSWKGHVGLFMGYDRLGERIYSLGGNQGNQVSITAYSSNTLLGFRRLISTTSVIMPKPDLQFGDTGEEVQNLQDALKLAGYNPGTSDGIYGNKTVAAVKLLQSTGSLKIDGIYGNKTAGFLSSILSE